MKCTIQWVDEKGIPTPDNEEAIGVCWRIAYESIYCGRRIQYEASEVFPVCAKHAEALMLPGMDLWRFEAMPAVSTEQS